MALPPETLIWFGRYGPGERVAEVQPGDFILTHGNTLFSRLIQLGQLLWFRGADAKYAHWNHAAIFVDSAGSIIEALGAGVTRRNVSAYDPTEYHVVRIEATPLDRQQAAEFAERCVGQEYGRFTILGIIFSLLTGLRLSIGFDGQKICSGLVARALERTGVFFEAEPSRIMPAELGKLYGVQPWPRGAPKGKPP